MVKALPVYGGGTTILSAQMYETEKAEGETDKEKDADDTEKKDGATALFANIFMLMTVAMVSMA